MSRSFGLKMFVAVITALALVIGAGSTVAVIYLGSHDLYTRTPEQLAQSRLEDIAWSISDNLVENYVRNHYGEIPEGHPDYRDNYESAVLSQGLGFYTLKDAGGNVLESTYDAKAVTAGMHYTQFTFSTQYPVVEVLPRDETDTTFPGDPDGTVPQATYAWDEYLHDEIMEFDDVIYHTMYFEGPELTLELWLQPQAWSVYSSDYWWAVNILYSLRFWFVAGVILGVSLFLSGITYLTWAVGTKKGREGVKLVGLNRLPLDLYGAAVGGIGVAGCYFMVLMMEYSVNGADLNLGTAFLACAAASAVALLAIIYYCAVAAQIKAGGWHWWKNSIVGRFLGFVWKYFLLALKGLAAVFYMLPLIWQWLVAAAVLSIGLVITTTQMDYGHEWAFLLWLMLIAAVVLYIGYALGVLMRGAKRMSNGDLTKKVPTRFLFGAFRDMADHLNALADVAVVAAKKQLRSERMKTELITNVSHDIKTPLTSIINFVDLLQKPHTPEQEREYLAVLDRQSQRMKKLIEDLMELSKATTGNLQVNPVPMDICEAVNQALGEFGDKLDAARLSPVLRRSEGPAMALADGRLVWRVFSNLLSNVVKYALPGTRIYLDVVSLEDRVLVSVKNISREELNMSAEELMERFVRGDASRNTEGSGLGLNIARSLMELQRGQLQLLVDGDLFKVTLVFPRA